VSGPGSAWMLARCDLCGAMQALPVEGGDLLDCCEDRNNYDASLTYVEQTSEWKPSTDITGQRPENWNGLHLEWKQFTDDHWLMLGNKRLAEISGESLGRTGKSVQALNELLASIPATQVKEKV
jgi:hypothetical protein